MFGGLVRPLACVVAAPALLAGLLSLAIAEEPPPSSPQCDSPVVTEELRASFNASEGARDLNVTAVAVRDAGEVDPESILAVRLDHVSPLQADTKVVIHCKAHLALNTGHSASAVFRVDMPPSGQEKIVEAPIYDTDFAMPALSARPSQAAPAVAPPRAAPLLRPSPMTPAIAGPQGAPAGTKAPDVPAGQGRTGPVPIGSDPTLAILPLGTVLCTSERDIESWATTHRPGGSCFHLSSPAPYVVISRNGTNREQVRLMGGNSGGAVAWTAAAPVMR